MNPGNPSRKSTKSGESWYKLKGDIAEQAVVLAALQRGWGVLQPLGDRLPYDLVFDVNGRLLRIQVKAAWWDEIHSWTSCFKMGRGGDKEIWRRGESKALHPFS